MDVTNTVRRNGARKTAIIMDHVGTKDGANLNLGQIIMGEQPWFVLNADALVSNHKAIYCTSMKNVSMNVEAKGARVIIAAKVHVVGKDGRMVMDVMA